MGFQDNFGIQRSIQDIAAQAYGSGIFEKEKGGQGYMGAFVDSKTGQVRVVKMLTHRSEYNAVKKAGGEANFAAVNSAIADSSKTLKDVLLKIADQRGDKAVLEKVTNLLVDKPLLSRKVVAQVVNALTEGLDEGYFSWNDAKAYKKTFADTSFETVRAQVEDANNSRNTDEGRINTLSSDFDVPIDQLGIQEDPSKVAVDAKDMAGKIRNGVFDQGWCRSFDKVYEVMTGNLNGLFKYGFGEASTQSAQLFLGMKVDEEPFMYTSDKPRATFHKVLRETLAKDIEKLDNFPPTENQKVRLMARAIKKAYVIARVQTAALEKLKQLEENLPPPDIKHETARKYALSEAYKRVDDLSMLSRGFDTHFSFAAMKDDLILSSMDKFSDGSKSLARWLMSTDAMSIGDLTDAEGTDEANDLSDRAPVLGEDEPDIESGYNHLFSLSDNSRYADSKSIISLKMNSFVSWLMPSADSLHLKDDGVQMRRNIIAADGFAPRID